MIRIILSIIIGLSVLSCTDKKEQNNNDTTKSELTKKEFYLNRMKERNFQFEIREPCEDALIDTVHARYTAYFDSKHFTETTAVAEFKFIEACCQEFLGDYAIKSDTIIFKYEQVNDEACSCLCWYKYKLTINKLKEKYSNIKVERI